MRLRKKSPPPSEKGESSWLIIKAGRYFLCRQCLEALDPFLDHIRGAWVWGWVEVCSGHRLGMLGRGQSCGRGCEAETAKRRGWLRIDCTMTFSQDELMEYGFCV